MRPWRMCRPSPRCRRSASRRNCSRRVSVWKMMLTNMVQCRYGTTSRSTDNAGDRVGGGNRLRLRLQAVRPKMLNTSNLPPGVHVERDRDDGTTHIMNLTDKAVDVDLGDG